MMRTALIAMLVAGFVQVGPGIAAEMSRAGGFSQFAEAIDGLASAEAAFIRRSKLKKKRTVGYRPVVVVGLSQDDTDPPDSVILTFREDPNLPEPLPQTVVLSLTSIDSETGDLTFAADMDFSEDAVGQAYEAVVDVRSGDVLLSSTAEVMLVEAADFPTVNLEVLNVPNEAGEVVLLAGDTVQVQFDITCEEPGDRLECDAMLAQSRRADRIQLRGDDGQVLSAKKRGRSLSGTVNLRTRRSHLGQRPSVVFVASEDGNLHANSSTPIVIVDNPATAELMERVALAEGAIAALSERVTTNEGDIGDNALDIQAHSGILIRHFMLISDEKISFDRLSEVVDNNTNTIDALNERVGANEGDIASNAAELDRNRRLINANVGTLAQQAASIRTNTQTSAANTAAIAEFGEGGFESSIEELDRYIHGRFSGDGTLFNGTDASDLGTASFKGGGFSVANVGEQLEVDVVMGLGQDGWLVVRPEDGGAAVAVPPLTQVGPGTFSSPFETENPDLVSGIYRTEVVAVLKDGHVVGPLTTFVVFEPEPTPPQVVSVGIQQQDPTNFEIAASILGSDTEAVTRVEVSIEAIDGPMAIPEFFEMETNMANKHAATFTFDALTFEEPDLVADQVYGVLIELKNADGFTLGSSFHHVVVEGLDEV